MMKTKIRKGLAAFLMLFVLTSAPVRALAAGLTTSAVTGNRYEVFLVSRSSVPLCTSSTMTFRADNILSLSCVQGTGLYLPLANTFYAVFWAPGLYLDNDVTIVMAGVTLDPFLLAAGTTFAGGKTEGILFAGYSLTPQ